MNRLEFFLNLCYQLNKSQVKRTSRGRYKHNQAKEKKHSEHKNEKEKILHQKQTEILVNLEKDIIKSELEGLQCSMKQIVEENLILRQQILKSTAPVANSKDQYSQKDVVESLQCRIKSLQEDNLNYAKQLDARKEDF